MVTEKGKELSDVENLREVKEEIQSKLNVLVEKIEMENQKGFMMKPLIYHVDVASMYPNIILTNRL